MKITKTLINKIIRNPKASLSEMTDDQVAEVIQYANYKYRNEKVPVMSDDMYDLIVDFLEQRAPKHPILKAIGAAVPVDDKRKVQLPYWMGSMDKIKSDGNELNRFTQAFPGTYVISDKLDGNSALLSYKSGGTTKLYTRGDGFIGQDISYIIPFIKGIPDILNLQQEYTVRGELIISKQDFEIVKDKGANARNMVAGLINAKLPDIELLKRVQFVAYTLISPNLKSSDQIESLKANGFETVYNIKLTQPQLAFDNLSDILVTRKQTSPYEIDGIIISHNNIHVIEPGKNPSYAFAFKNIITQETAEVVVTNIEWNISKDGYLKPVIEFNPVHLNGVMIKRATGFNAEYIKDNIIGPGSRIIITRSGDVIPYVVRVLTPSSSGSAMMPNAPFHWIPSGKDIVVVGATKELDMKQIEHFFEKLKIPGVSSGTVKKLTDAGWNTIPKIFSLRAQDIASIPGLGEKSGQKIHAGLQKAIQDMDCITLMEASNAFGRGFAHKRLQAIVNALPQVLDGKFKPTVAQLAQIDGVSKITADNFIQGLDSFRTFMKATNIQCNTHEKTEQQQDGTATGRKLLNDVVVLTGFRDSKIEEFVASQGGRVASSMSKKVTIVIAKDTSKETSKIKEAMVYGARIMSIHQFKQQYQMPQ